MTFPPKARKEDEVRAMIGAVGCAVPARSAWYVSSPLTTGERAGHWISSLPGNSVTDTDRFRADVLEPNRIAAAEFVAALRSRLGEKVVIDPLALPDVKGWIQDDYRDFWGRVIETYVNTVVFRDGWEHSSGCAYEYLRATEVHANTLDSDLKPLGIETAIRALKVAVASTHNGEDSVRFLSSVLLELERLSASALRDDPDVVAADE